MALDSIDQEISSLDGVVIPQPHIPEGVLIHIIIDKDRADRQKEIRQRVGLDLPEVGEAVPFPSHRSVVRDDDDGGNYRGYCTIDM